jgi:hypothetical protein
VGRSATSMEPLAAEQPCDFAWTSGVRFGKERTAEQRKSSACRALDAFTFQAYRAASSREESAAEFATTRARSGSR